MTEATFPGPAGGTNAHALEDLLGRASAALRYARTHRPKMAAGALAAADRLLVVAFPGEDQAAEMSAVLDQVEQQILAADPATSTATVIQLKGDRS